MCITCTRRELIAGSLTSLCSGVAHSQLSVPIYCSWNIAQLRGFSAHSSSGNPLVDAAIIAEIKKIVRVLQINPGFKFIDDPSPNAYAVPESLVAGTQGTVYMGLNLINSEFNNSPYGGVAVAGICAHECGHVLQYQNGYVQLLAGPTAQLIELHADYVAGFYFGRDRSHSKEHVEVFGRSLFSRGDYNYNSQLHHGTPEQRLRAMQGGYDAGVSTTDIRAAIDQGVTLVRRI